MCVKLFYHVVVVVLIIEGVIFLNVMLCVSISALQGRSFVNLMLNDLFT